MEQKTTLRLKVMFCMGSRFREMETNAIAWSESSTRRGFCIL